MATVDLTHETDLIEPSLFRREGTDILFNYLKPKQGLNNIKNSVRTSREHRISPLQRLTV